MRGEGVHDARTFYECIHSNNITTDHEAYIAALQDRYEAVKKAGFVAPVPDSFVFFQGCLAGMRMAFKIQKAFLEQQAHEQHLDVKTGRPIKKHRPS